MDKLIVIFPVTVFYLILLWYLGIYRLLRPEQLPVPVEISEETSEETPEQISKERPHLDAPIPRYSLTRHDLLPMLAVTIIYAAVAFTLLGDTDAPQSCREYNAGDTTVLDFGTVINIDKIMYYPSLHTGTYTVEYSDDGSDWQSAGEMTQKYNQLFKWITPDTISAFSARYIRLTADNRLDLAEIAFIKSDGTYALPSYDSVNSPLFDEQDLVPERATYMNGTYFDEIYHARTALENIENVKPYEVSHPPLGKLIISTGIRIFGMTPFGWRFMGTLFGVLMLPVLYALLKLMFGSTPAAACATFVFAFDFMHFVQTRIATIDTYGVFFILVSFLFMFLFVRQDPDKTKLRARLLPLALCGITWGIGCACKWTVVYDGAALALIWFIYWIARGIRLKKDGRLRRLFGEISGNVLFCLIFFVAVPAAIYYASYYPYGKAEGLSGFAMYFTPEYWHIVLDNQIFMFDYHKDLVATHPYSSRWWQWIIDARPILYFLDYISDSTKSAFGAFNGPMLCWGGFIAMLYMGWRSLFRRDFRALMIVVGYLASLLPWVIITRLTFAYHYFPCMLFLAVALGYVFAQVCLKAKNWRPWLYSFCGACTVLFIAFYPVLTGIPFSRWYTNTFLRWFPGAWPF
ncbi:MAG: phospholipid carrier-dependent glycosyltransferase [Oscillospiraceae bacterium]